MLQFNESSIECSYILNLLYNFYIPNMRVLDLKTPPYYNEHFIRDKSIFTYRKPNKEELKSGKYIKDNYYEFLDSDYEPGKKYNGITKNLISESNNYNTQLHEVLGNYLRFLRSYYGVDLMPLYNCFSNRFIDNLFLPLDRDNSGPKIYGVKVFAFPVKFGHKYSIFCKDNCSALIQPAFFNGKDLLSIKKYFSSQTTEYWYFDPVSISLSQYKDEYPYEMKNINELTENQEDILTLYHNEGNLYLFVLIPDTNASNLVVIEDNSTRVINNTLIERSEQIPFSDKLIGYILNYFISPLTDILENINIVLKILSSKTFYIKDLTGRRVGEDGTPPTDDKDLLPGMKLSNYIPGVFDYNTRKFIYDLYRFAGIPDFTGYIDRDVEQLILRDSQE